MGICPYRVVARGHEVVGVVQALGGEVQDWTIGQRVGVAWPGGTCGGCRYCLGGDENLCDAPVRHGRPVADRLLRKAGLADLIVINAKRGHWFWSDPRAAAAAVAFKAGRRSSPADRQMEFDPPGLAVVAWDGSAPAMAALRGGVPLLALARGGRTVTIMRPGTPCETRASAHAARRYLPRYGVGAQVVERSAGCIDEELYAACEAFGAAYCLMGAYGHGRLTEDLVGGVTRRMLEAETLPLVLRR